MKSYILKFQRKLDSLNRLAAGVTDEITQDVDIVLNEYCNGLFLDTHGYELSKCRQEMNELLSSKGVEIDNHQLKTFLLRRLYRFKSCH